MKEERADKLQIARNEFPIFKPAPSLPLLESQQTTQPANSSDPPSSESADKENAPPAPAESNHVTESDDVLPRELLIRLNSVIKTLTTYFKTYPPHTIQRLSELVLEPRRHYRNLPAYLHGLDRVVNVTSGANTYPLPAAFPVSSGVLTNGGTNSNSNTLTWGNSTAPTNLGSDESLGGALLTPIPWLANGNGNVGRNSSRSNSGGSIEREVRTESTETIEGPNGAGSIETVTVSVYGSGIPNQSTQENNASSISSLRAEGGVTQGELLRQEQELNVVPVAQITGRISDADGKSEDDEIPHARGPEEVGVEDMGPQSSSMSDRNGSNMESHGIDIEAAVGRRNEPEAEKEKEDSTMEDKSPPVSDVPRTPKREAEEELGGEAKRAKSEEPTSEMEEQSKEEEKKGNDDDEMLLTDADGRADDEKKVGEGDGTQVGADAVDTTGT